MLLDNHSDISDKELVISIKNDDHNAFQELYFKYYPSLIKFAWYRTFSVEVSKDLVQELFCKIWLFKKNLDPEKSIKALLYKSLGNLIINHKKLGVSNNISIDNLGNRELLHEVSQETSIDIRDAVLSLPEKLQTVFTLHRYDGFNYAEIAEICEISKKTVEKRMSKAFNILRKIFPAEYFNSR